MPHKDKIAGGLADKKKPEDFDQEQLKAGTAVEHEHAESSEIAQEIAMDHLTENSQYYIKLKAIEKHVQEQDELLIKAHPTLLDRINKHPVTIKKAAQKKAADAALSGPKPPAQPLKANPAPPTSPKAGGSEPKQTKAAGAAPVPGVNNPMSPKTSDKPKEAGGQPKEEKPTTLMGKSSIDKNELKKFMSHDEHNKKIKLAIAVMKNLQKRPEPKPIAPPVISPQTAPMPIAQPLPVEVAPQAVMPAGPSAKKLAAQALIGTKVNPRDIHHAHLKGHIKTMAKSEEESYNKRAEVHQKNHDKLDKDPESMADDPSIKYKMEDIKKSGPNEITEKVKPVSQQKKGNVFTRFVAKRNAKKAAKKISDSQAHEAKYHRPSISQEKTPPMVHDSFKKTLEDLMKAEEAKKPKPRAKKKVEEKENAAETEAPAKNTKKRATSKKGSAPVATASDSHQDILQVLHSKAVLPTKSLQAPPPPKAPASMPSNRPDVFGQPYPVAREIKAPDEALPMGHPGQRAQDMAAISAAVAPNKQAFMSQKESGLGLPQPFKGTGNPRANSERFEHPSEIARKKERHIFNHAQSNWKAKAHSASGESKTPVITRGTGNPRANAAPSSAKANVSHGIGESVAPTQATPSQEATAKIKTSNPKIGPKYATKQQGEQKRFDMHKFMLGLMPGSGIVSRVAGAAKRAFSPNKDLKNSLVEKNDLIKNHPLAHLSPAHQDVVLGSSNAAFQSTAKAKQTKNPADHQAALKDHTAAKDLAMHAYKTAPDKESKQANMDRVQLHDKHIQYHGSSHAAGPNPETHMANMKAQPKAKHAVKKSDKTEESARKEDTEKEPVHIIARRQKEHGAKPEELLDPENYPEELRSQIPRFDKGLAETATKVGQAVGLIAKRPGVGKKSFATAKTKEKGGKIDVHLDTKTIHTDKHRPKLRDFKTEDTDKESSGAKFSRAAASYREHPDRKLSPLSSKKG